MPKAPQNLHLSKPPKIRHSFPPPVTAKNRQFTPQRGFDLARQTPPAIPDETFIGQQRPRQPHARLAQGQALLKTLEQSIRRHLDDDQAQMCMHEPLALLHSPWHE